MAGKSVLLKPNIVFDALPEKAISTHPVFLEAAIRLVLELGAGQVLVGDSPGLHAPGFSGKVSGLGEVTRKFNAQWVDFTQEKVEVAFPDGKVAKKFTISGAVKKADVIISLPKLKTHQLMYFTGALKNMFGLVPSVAKSAFHVRFPDRARFASMIVDLNLAVTSHYALMDAITGMEGPGPSGGEPRHIGLVLASPNLLAIDAAACTIIGYHPEEIPVNADALARGLWLSSFDEIEYPALSPFDAQIADFVKVPFQKSRSQLLEFIMPRPLRALRNSFAPRPTINHSKCVLCGDCLKICASKVMSFLEANGKRQVVINYRRCIRCFCCHEICPKKAIDISRRKIFGA